MSDNVVTLSVNTRLDIDPERVLSAAEGKLESVIVIGYDENGDEYFATSVSNRGTIILLLERFKKALLEDAD